MNAIRKAKQMNILVFGFLGSKGGKALEHCDETFLVPSNITSHIQELHITAGHALMGCIEDNLFSDGYLKKT